MYRFFHFYNNPPERTNKQKEGMLGATQTPASRVPWSEEVSPAVEVSLCSATHYCLTSSSALACVYRCSAAGWGFHKISVTMVMDLRQAEQSLSLGLEVSSRWWGASLGAAAWKLLLATFPEAACRGAELPSLPTETPGRSRGAGKIQGGPRGIQNLVVGIWHGSWRL